MRRRRLLDRGCGARLCCPTLTVGRGSVRHGSAPLDVSCAAQSTRRASTRTAPGQPPVSRVRAHPTRVRAVPAALGW
ncbi:hypothetical protein ACFPRL_17310 [Pseudoclavibacter helvolus]